MKTIRCLALVTLVIAIPIAFLKFPWLPGTFLEFCRAAGQLGSNGSDAYVGSNNRHFVRLLIAVILYVFGLWATLGLSGMVIGLCSKHILRNMTWISGIIVGLGLPAFELARIGPETKHFYVYIVVYLPICVAIVSLIGLILSLRLNIRYQL